MGLAVLLMVLDHRGAGFTQVRAALSMPLSFLEYGISWPIQFVGKVNTMVSTHDTLVKENVDLKAQHLLLKAQVQRLVAIESENNQLKALLRSSTQVNGKVLIAQLLAVDSDPFVNQVMLDKGSREGVYIGQPVLDANGVMGKVIQVSPMTSRILLITDNHSGIPVQDMRNGVRAIAMGDSYSGNLHLINLPQTVDIRVGDQLVTSGLGEHYPMGYPVGEITAVIKDPGMQFATIVVAPKAQPDKSQEVLLIWPAQKVAAEKVVASIPVTQPLSPAHA